MHRVGNSRYGNWEAALQGEGTAGARASPVGLRKGQEGGWDAVSKEEDGRKCWESTEKEECGVGRISGVSQTRVRTWTFAVSQTGN